MNRIMVLFALVCIGGLVLAPSAVNGATYVFGEDGNIKNLTYYGSTWTSANTYIIAGDCHVNNDDELTIEDGVEVLFDYDYGGDYGSPMFPTIKIYGTIVCEGTENSQVWFKNYSGTNKGEFEGLLLDGTSTNEGELEASHTVFEYGGKSTALIQLDEDAVLDLDNCFIRLSDTDGIATIDESSSIDIHSCYIDSNDNDGIDAQNELELLQIENTVLFYNGGAGIHIESLRNHDGMWLKGLYVRGNNLDGLVLGPQSRGILVRNCQFYCNGPEVAGQGNGIRIDCDEGNFYCTIMNCVAAGNSENGIYIEDMDPWEILSPIRILNSVLWDNGDN